MHTETEILAETDTETEISAETDTESFQKLIISITIVGPPQYQEIERLLSQTLTANSFLE